jgi:hypothetical protein
MIDNDSHLIYEAYINDGVPPGGWKISPEMAKVLDDLYSEIYDNWVPVKRAIAQGQVPQEECSRCRGTGYLQSDECPECKGTGKVNTTVFEGTPAERKMTLMDIVPSNKGEPKTLVDWIMTKIKEVITIAGNWVDNDVKTNSRLIFDPPASIDDYSEALREFRIGLVGFGNKPRTVWHMIDSQNVRRMAPDIQDGIDELFDLTREIIHYNREQTSGDKPNPTDQDPSDDPNQEMY